jgi:hypothetical protein
MSELSSDTLVIAIQAVDAEMLQIEEQLEGIHPGEHPDLDDLLMAYQKAARELKFFYEQAQLLALDLPPYEELIRGRVTDEEIGRPNGLH